MPVIRQKRIFREDLRNNPNVLYLFGDNEKRTGLGGQAKEMRGEPNALGVRTKVAPSMEKTAFWADDRYDACCKMIDEDLADAIDKIMRGGIVVIPADGLGTGFSELPTRAPKVHRYLQQRIDSFSNGNKNDMQAVLQGCLARSAGRVAMTGENQQQIPKRGGAS